MDRFAFSAVMAGWLTTGLLLAPAGASAAEAVGTPVPLHAQIRQLAQSFLENDLKDYHCTPDPMHPGESCSFEPGGYFGRCILSGGDLAHKADPGLPIADYWEVECLLKDDGLRLTSLKGRFGVMDDSPLELDSRVIDRYVKPAMGYHQVRVAFSEWAAESKMHKIDLKATVSSRRFIYGERMEHRDRTYTEMLTRGSDDFTVQSIKLMKTSRF